MRTPPECSLDELVDRLCTEQQQTWASGNPVPVEEYLNQHIALGGDQDCVFTLIYNEYLVRENLGELVASEEYFGRFPKFSRRLRRQLALHRAVEGAHSWPGSPAGLWKPNVHLTKQADVSATTAIFTGTKRFRILGRLGAGAMGTVYLAYDRRWNQSIALKVLHENDAAAIHRIKCEFRVLAGLSHPNLVDFHELVWSEKHQQCFLTMELVEGLDLIKYCRSARLSAPASVARYACLYDGFRQLAEALYTLHEAGQIHADVKPSNVLITDAGRAVLLDFGLACEHLPPNPARLRGKHLCGTVAYMAPEVLRGEHPSPASDWYSLGAMLYEALTEKLPVSGSVQQIMAAKQWQDPPPPLSLVNGLPEDLDQLCRDLLHRDPTKRPAAQEILLRLGSCDPAAPPWLVPRYGKQVPFVGRDRELVRLRAAIRQTGQGRYVSLLVRGASGTGKTELVGQFLSELESQPDVLILSGRCHELESVPFRAFDELMDDLSTYLGKLALDELKSLLPPNLASLTRMFPTLLRIPAAAARVREPAGSQSQHELRSQAVRALRELLKRLGQQRRLVLFIDDLQWGGVDSAVLLSEVFQSGMQIPLLLLGTYRIEEPRLAPRRVQKRHLERMLWSDELALQDLPEVEARQLALHCLEREGCPLGEHAEAVVREAGGHPFLIVTLAHLSQCSGSADGKATVTAAQIDDLLWERICRLSDPAKRLLEILAVAGHPLAVPDACRAAQIHVDAQRGLSELRSQRLIRIAKVDHLGNLAEPYHHRIGECVVGHLAEDVMCRCHQRLAEVLESRRRPNPQLLARHYLAAGEPARAYELAALAADNAARLMAFDEAANLYRLALETFQGPPSEHLRLQLQLAQCLASAERAVEAGRISYAAQHRREACGPPVP